MLLRFFASNFLSIAGELEFNMFPYGKIKGHANHVYKTPQVDLLKAAAIYGANGSGKSNLVKAMSYLRELVVEGEIPKIGHPDITFKLNEEFEDKSTTLEIEFLSGEKYFAYGVSFKNHRIREEWLFEIFPKSGKQEMIFDRKMGEDEAIRLDIHARYKMTEKDKVRLDIYKEEILKENHSALHLLGNSKYLDIQEAYQWFNNKLIIVFPDTKVDVLPFTFNKAPSFKLFTEKIISEFDTGIKSLEIQVSPFEKDLSQFDEAVISDIYEKLNHGEQLVIITTNENDKVVVGYDDKNELAIYKLITNHEGQDGNLVKFYVEHESDGTRRLLDIVPTLGLLVDNEIVCIVDELDRSLHPTLIKKFVSLFLELETKGQLIFTTHESNLLDLELFRQDEIWFMEKDKSGASRAYSLSEFMPRYDADIRKGYLNGRFGAIPFLGNLDDLNWKHAEAEQTL